MLLHTHVGDELGALRTMPSLAHSGAGGALVTCVDGLWFESFAPLGHDDLTTIEHHLADARRLALLDLRVIGPSGLGFGVMQRLVGWRALGRLPDRIAFVSSGGSAGVLLVAVAQALRPRAAAVVLAMPEEALVDAAARASWARAAPLLAERRAALASWIALRHAVLARPEASFAMLAHQHGTSPARWRRALAAAGASFRGEQRRARMELAYERVVAGRDKLAVVASELGFASESQLCRAFRRDFGMAPSVARARLA